MNNDLEMFATAITDTAASCNCHTSRATIRINGPRGSASSSGGGNAAVAQATVSMQLYEDDFPTPGDIVLESEHESYCPIRMSTFMFVRPRSIIRTQGYTSPYQWTPIGSHGGGAPQPVEEDFYWGCRNPVDPCLGNCMHPWKVWRHDKGYGHSWVRVQGLAVDLRVGLACFGRPRNNGDLKPACIQPKDPKWGMCGFSGPVRY